jgi:hypothetical protein
LPFQSLIDDIINSINNLIYQAISSLESGLLATPPERLGFGHASNGSTIPDTDEDGNVVYPEAKLEIENGLHQLETLLEANVDKAFDKFEIYVLRNILTVPEDLLFWVRLKHYEVGGRLRNFSLGGVDTDLFVRRVSPLKPLPIRPRLRPSTRSARSSSRLESSTGH